MNVLTDDEQTINMNKQNLAGNLNLNFDNDLWQASAAHLFSTLRDPENHRLSGSSIINCRATIALTMAT